MVESVSDLFIRLGTYSSKTTFSAKPGAISIGEAALGINTQVTYLFRGSLELLDRFFGKRRVGEAQALGPKIKAVKQYRGNEVIGCD